MAFLGVNLLSSVTAEKKKGKNVKLKLFIARKL